MKCMPPNFPRAWAFPETIKIFLSRRWALLVPYEFNATYRQIFFDGRKLPEDMLPDLERLSGRALGGDTLVVAVGGVSRRVMARHEWQFLLEQAKVTERVRRPELWSLD